MKKLLPAILFILFQAQSSRAQVSALSNPLRDSVNIFSERGKYARALSYAELWREKVEADKGLSSVEYGAILNLLGDINRKAGLFFNGDGWLEKAMQVFNFDSASRRIERIKCFESKGDLERDLGKYEVANTWYQKAVSLVDSSIKEENTLLAHLCSDLGLLYMDMGKADESGFYHRKSLGIFLSQSGENSSEVAACYSNLGNLMAYLADFKKAEGYYNKAFSIRKQVLKPNHPDLATSYISFGILFSNLGDHDKAKKQFFKALEIQKKAFGNAHPLVAETYNSLGLVHSLLGEFALSEKYYSMALNLRKGVLPENHPDLALNYNNLGTLLIDRGFYRKGGSYLIKALEIRKKCFGESHPEVAEALGNLGIFYSDLGDYEKADQYYSQELEILKANFGEAHPEIASSLNAFGSLNMEVGNYEKAIFYFNSELDLLLKIYSKENGDIADAMGNLGSAYFELGDFHKAEIYTRKSLAINRKTLGSQHPSTADNYFNLSQLYFSSGSYFKAGKLNRLALNLRRKLFKELHPDVAECYSNEADGYELRGEYSKAIAYHKKALSILLEIFGEEHPDVQLKKKDLAGFYWARKDVSNASLWFGKLRTGILGQIERYFPALSESEKAKYISKVSEGLIGCYSFCVEQGNSNPGLLAQLFDSQLITKGILLNASLKLKRSLRMSTDLVVQKKFQEWEELQDQISRNFSNIDEEPFAPGSLLMKSEKLEKELIQRTGKNLLTFTSRRKKWQDIQKKLKPGEAAIEMVRVRKFGIANIVTDTSDPKKPTYKIKGLTDTAYYAALIVKPTSKYPEMVLLKNGNALEERWILVYKNSMKAKIPDQTSYNQFWKKIDAKLGPAVKRVYFSPDGVYNSINLSTLQNPQTGKFLLDERDIRLVTNTQDLLTARISRPNQDYACLVGYPDYNTDKDKRAATFQAERSRNESWYNLNLTRSDAFSELPATKTEVENIGGILTTQGWKVETLMREKALEDRLKEVAIPRVLHIATHGYFQSDSTKGNNPLIRSGLLLTGAFKTLAGEKDDNIDDGILTAFEAMNLNLDNTDLVVLSACETGLGEIRNGEGVYGLQRAFKVAGAKSVIMSLWKVDDVATQELMVSFYKHWLSAAGGNKRSAFLAAQKELKAKFPNPYYWGAFVMVGE